MPKIYFICIFFMHLFPMSESYSTLCKDASDPSLAKEPLKVPNSTCKCETVLSAERLLK